MRTYFYERYEAGCSEKYSNDENLLHHCCKQVKSSVTDVCMILGHSLLSYAANMIIFISVNHYSWLNALWKLVQV